jgi:hypothetical protein
LERAGDLVLGLLQDEVWGSEGVMCWALYGVMGVGRHLIGVDILINGILASLLMYCKASINLSVEILVQVFT